MTATELVTAARLGLPVTVLLLRNRTLGMVRQQQQYFYGKRYELTYLGKRPADTEHPDRLEEADPLYVPDFLKVAGAYGIDGIRVDEEDDIVPALQKARDAQKNGRAMLVEFDIAAEDVVLPMVKGGMANSDMILK